jgi:hypothetical protein
MGNNHSRAWKRSGTCASIGLVNLRRVAYLGAAVVVLAGVFVLLAVGAGAATITQPKGPYAVAADSKGNPAAFVVVASGFPAGANIYAEQCDGNPPTTPQWSPTINCDLGSAPPPAIADGNGLATFDGQSMFQPVAGVSPQHLFNCIASGTTPPKNRLKTYTNCQLRVSSNNSTSTPDQTFITLVLPGPNAPRQPAATSTTQPAGGDSSSTTVPKRKAAAGSKGSKAPKGNLGAHRKAAASDSGTPLVHIAATPSSSSDDHRLTSSGAVLGYALILGGLLLAGVWRVVFHPPRVA